MQVTKPYETIYSIGILWNISNKFYREMMRKIAISNPVIQIRKYEMGDKYIEFVRRCYQEDVSEGYLSKKVNRMEKSDVKNMIVFVARIDNPEYEFDEIKEKYPCKEIATLKRKIRNEFSDKIDDYFYDVLLHMSDDMTETNKMMTILADYENKVVEDFVRKGYETYIKSENKDVIKKHTYCEALNSLEKKNEEYEK